MRIKNKLKSENSLSSGEEILTNDYHEEVMCYIELEDPTISEKYCRISLDKEKVRFKFVFANQLSEKAPILK